MNWTTPTDIRKQVHKLWDRGEFLSPLIDGDGFSPRRLSLKGPTSAELSTEFAAVREWIDALRKGETKGYRIVWREMNHRVIGRNSLPKEIWIDSPADALEWIGKRRDARAFGGLVDETRLRRPELLPWLERQPLRALELQDVWPTLLDAVGWILQHPRPGIYLRQVDVPGLDTKFVERFRGILSELLDLALPPEAIAPQWTGAAGFCRRYGFREKPLRIRFRILDARQPILPTVPDQDITVTSGSFSRLDLHVRRVFITENEINFLSFPQCPDSMVVFGAGYGFEVFAESCWLLDRQIYYWGDIDTHGFAILDQLRTVLPHVRSLLMDSGTLLAHRRQWVSEPRPEKRDLPRLTEAERQLYDDLRDDTFGKRVRLEQEKIRYSSVEHALSLLAQQ